MASTIARCSTPSSAHPGRLRAVAAVTEDVTDGELARMHGAGVRGIRVNLVDRGGMPFRSLDALAHMGERIRDFGWHVELLVHVEAAPELRGIMASLAVPAIVGHVGYTKVTAGLDHPGYREFLAMLRDGLGWVKLTAPYRISAQERLPYGDVTPFVRAVLAAAPDRIVWGSDWPHVMVTRPMPNDGDLVDLLATWVPDAAHAPAHPGRQSDTALLVLSEARLTSSRRRPDRPRERPSLRLPPRDRL